MFQYVLYGRCLSVRGGGGGGGSRRRVRGHLYIIIFFFSWLCGALTVIEEADQDDTKSLSRTEFKRVLQRIPDFQAHFTIPDDV